jgi:hypothetical protein
MGAIQILAVALGVFEFFAATKFLADRQAGTVQFEASMVTLPTRHCALLGCFDSLS